MAIVIGTQSAWLGSYSGLTPEDFKNPKEKIIDGLSFAKVGQDMTSTGWTYVGEATITVELVDKDTLINNKVEALRAEAVTIRAEATMKCTRIEEKINQLLCLENNPTIVEDYDDSIPF